MHLGVVILFVLVLVALVVGSIMLVNWVLVGGWMFRLPPLNQAANGDQ